jgi:serine/threonine protein kinase
VPEYPQIPGYRIIKALTESKRAQVYLAEQTSLQRMVALKLINDQLAQDPDARKRLIEEGKAAARLTHPNLQAVFDIGEVSGRYFIATEHIAGGNLRDRFKGGSLSAHEALKIARDMACGLAFLHAQGYLHRDIKPSNVLFREDGTAALSDQGVTRTAASQDIAAVAMGSPAYMSPEQVNGAAADARSDVYAFGIVLHEMLTGALPFDAEDPYKIAIMHVQNPVPALPDNLRALRDLHGHCLAKNPAERAANGAALVHAIDAILQGAAAAKSQSAAQEQVAPVRAASATVVVVPPAEKPPVAVVARDAQNSATADAPTVAREAINIPRSARPSYAPTSVHESKSSTVWLILAMIIALALGLGYWWFKLRTVEPEPPPATASESQLSGSATEKDQKKP